ncbi:MAG: small multi-drug export protein [Oscillospiraceae bacterium]|jgi:uncharacterized membrane protein|nr:small multi-drug export protein [Oscillospiraceae bacterium]
MQMLAEHAKDLIVAFFMSMLPILELRGGIVFAAAREIPLPLAVAVCYLGNILPIPFILLFLRRVFVFLERFKYTKRLVSALERRARKKEKNIQKYQMLGLFMLVAIPLPGTGAWTGALVSVVFDMQIRKSFPLIALGVLAAGVIMVVISYLIPSMSFFQ